MIPDNKKLCPFCNQVKFKSQFSKRKYTEDGLSPCCKDCIRIYKKWFLWNFDDIADKQIIIDYLTKNNKDIKINGIDLEKIRNIRIKINDIPGIITPILKTLPQFLLKYDISFEEFLFIILKCQENEFFFV